MTTGSTLSMEGETLRQMERDLRSRLRAHRLSGAFVDRTAEDALQRGVVEYLRARDAGTEIREPKGFVLQAAFRRAIDELRRESRTRDGAAVESLLETRPGAPSAEEVALEGIGAAELHAAIGSLPAEERQALRLHYFEELSDARSAKLLYCSERTFRRRLRKAIADLAERLGVPAPEPGSHLGLEVGLASWVGLRGADVALSAHPLDPVAGAVEGLHHWLTRALGRIRNPMTQLAGEGAPERLGAIAGGPAGKVIGGCAGAAVICALSGVVGPGVHLGGPSMAGEGSRGGGAGRARPERATRPLVTSSSEIRGRSTEPKVEATQVSAAPPATPSPRHRRHARAPRRGDHPAAHSKRHAAPVTTSRSIEEERVEEQFSGTAQVAAEAETEKQTAPADSAPNFSIQEAAPAHSAPSAGAAHASAGEEREVEEQFGGPLTE